MVFYSIRRFSLIKKCEIIKKQKEFNNIIHNGNYFKSSHFVIYTFKNYQNNIRFGLAIGKKVGNAVVRNRLKRQTKSIIDANKKLFPSGFDYIIMIKKSCSTAKYKELEVDLETLIKEKVKK